MKTSDKHRRLSILHVVSSPSSVGGAELMMLQLAKSAEVSGHHVKIVNLFSSNNTMLKKSAEGMGYQEISHKSPLAFIIQIRKLRREIKHHQFDLVHLHMFHAGIFFGLVLRSKSIVKLWTFQHGDHTQSSRNFWFRSLEKIAAKKYDLLVSMSPDITKMLQMKFHIDPEKIRLIPNSWSGKPLPRLVPSSNSIVCVAKLRKEKDHQTLFRAFAKLRESGQEVDLVIVGDGPELENLRSLASELSISNFIKFEGFSSDIWPYLASAKVFVLTSRTEPFGIVILEAMAAGIPIVSTDATGPSFLIEDQVNGLLVPAGDVQGVSDAIGMLLSDESLHRRLANAGIKTADLFPQEKINDSYLDLYQKLASS